MSVSKKLSITQLILVIVALLSFIVVICLSGITMSLGSIYSGGILAIISGIGIPIALLVIGILQIVYFSKEKPGGVYLASGILGITAIIPIINFFIWIAIIILSIICIVKKQF